MDPLHVLDILIVCAAFSLYPTRPSLKSVEPHTSESCLTLRKHPGPMTPTLHRFHPGCIFMRKEILPES